MFSKPTTKPPARPADKAPGGPPPLTADEMRRAIGPGNALAAPARSSVGVSVIGAGMTLEGGLSGDGDLRVDGVVRGDVRVGRITISESGQIEGSVTADQVECDGRVVGSITAKQIQLSSTAYVDGDITHEQLAMETGAFFQGRSMKLQRPAQNGQHLVSSPAKTDTATLAAAN
jgi:cytoskeletal protein CcmA (bactofilin family)